MDATLRLIGAACLAILLAAAPAAAVQTAGNPVPGSTDYPHGGMRWRDTLSFVTSMESPGCAVIDEARGFAYFAGQESPATVAKVAVGSGQAAPVFLDLINLEAGEDRVSCGGIDAARGYAYFATFTKPVRLVKVALGERDACPRRVGSVILATGEDEAASCVVDAESGFAYIGTRTVPGRIIKVALGDGDSPPERVGAIALEFGENYLTSAVLIGGNAALFGTSNPFTSGVPDRIVKVALGKGDALPSRIGAAEMAVEAKGMACGVFDSVREYAFFGTLSGHVLKLRVGGAAEPPSLAASIALPTEDRAVHAAALDPSAACAYFVGAFDSPVRFSKVALGEGDGAPVLLGSSELPAISSDYSRVGFVLDSTRDCALVGAGRNPVQVAKFGLGKDAEDPVFFDSVDLSMGSLAEFSLLDNSRGYAYLPTTGTPCRILKLALREPNSRPRYVGSMMLESSIRRLDCGVIDTAAGYAYFAYTASTGASGVLKVASGEGDSTPRAVGIAAFRDGGGNASCAAIDPVGGFAYFGTQTIPGEIVKVLLGEGQAPPSRYGTLRLEQADGAPRCAFFDPVGGFSYFGTTAQPARVVKVAPGTLVYPARVGAAVLEPGEDNLSCVAFDQESGIAVFGTDTEPGRVVKVAISGDKLPVRVGGTTLDTDVGRLISAGLQPDTGSAFFTTWRNGIVRTRLGSAGEAPSQIGRIWSEITIQLSDGLVDGPTGFGHFFGGDGALHRIELNSEGHRGYVHLMRIQITETASVSDVRFYSHVADGSLRLSIHGFRGDALWESGSVTNTASGGALVVPISSGHPSTLVLAPGNYWGVWQTDSAAAVPSTTPTTTATSYCLPHPYGEFSIPSILPQEARVSEVWTLWLTYARDSDPDQWGLY